MSEWHVKRGNGRSWSLYKDAEYYGASNGLWGRRLVRELNRLEALAELARRAVPMVEAADSWAASENLHDFRDRCDDWLRDHKTLTEQ